MSEGDKSTHGRSVFVKMDTVANFSFPFFWLPVHDRDSTEGIPEGFFDDPKLDAKVSY